VLARIVAMAVSLSFVLALPLAGIAAADEHQEEALQGRVFVEVEGEREFVEGVVITVLRDGEEIGSSTTDEEGFWRVPLPGPGTYTAVLDEATLPEETELRDPEAGAERTLTVRTGQTRTVVYPLGEPTGVAAVLLARAAQGFYNGIKFGVIIAITSIGLSLVYGTTRLVNFAHGEMVTFGAIVAWWLNVVGPQGLWRLELQLIIAGLLAVAIGGLLGAGMERGLWLPLRNRKTGLIQMLVISIGLMLLMRYVLLFLYGGRRFSYADYAVMSAIRVGPITTNARDLAVIVLSLATLTAVGLMIQRTRMGKAMRAVSDNVSLAEASGIDVKRVILFVWVLAGALAALGGIFLGAVENVNYLMGFRLLLLIFAAVILGGIGTAFGAMVGGLIIGVVTEMSVLFAPTEVKMAWGLLALVVVLLVRPWGIFGERERIG
jgi:neutral amino acid transport system permease protein